MKPAEAFHVVVHLKEEMAARGWTEDDVIRGTWMGKERLLEILDHDEISLAESELLGHKFGVSPALFANLQLAWKRHQKESGEGRF